MDLIHSEKILRMKEKFSTLQTQLAEELPRETFVRLSKEYAELEPVVLKILDLEGIVRELGEVDLLLEETKDPDLVEMAEGEKKALEERHTETEAALKILLLPKDSADCKNIILEVRAGTGGEEAALFAGDLFRMYQRYAAVKGWRVELISINPSEMGGLKEVVASISGMNVYANLKFESGVHRVQRVPDTETQGRIHTSAATVAVLPEAEEVDIQIEDKDLRIDVYRSSGPGGQSVNTTDSAVRITHLPTGLVVIQQDEKSQHKNKAKALKVLRARLFERERERLESERSAQRRGQVGSGDRSERIRTYNYPQGRVTDHRIHLTLYKLPQIMEGEALGEMIEALITTHQAELLAIFEA